MKKIMSILGTRPEIIKLSPLLPLLDREFNNILVHTGQHYDYGMDSIFFKELGLKNPRYNLGVGSHSQGKQVALILERLEPIMLKEKPDLVLVQGDTNTAMAGALLAYKLHLRLAHIEAGCRSFSRMPEEINRILADHASDYLFAPDKEAVNNLLKEGISQKRIFHVGSLAIDSYLRNMDYAEKSKILDKLNLKKGKYILTTIHRETNTSNLKNLKSIVNALNVLSAESDIIFPLHPRTRKFLEIGRIRLNNSIKSTEPLGYLDFLKLLSNARFVISDSGGVQEEAAFLNVPCLIPRNETEWERYVQLGKNFLTGAESRKIISTARALLDDEKLEHIKRIRCSFETGAERKIINTLKRL